MQIKQIQAFQTWPLRHQVMWPDQPMDYVKLEEDENGIHFGLFLGVELVSVVSLFIDNGKAQFRKFATLQREQGKGYGSTLLKHLFDIAKGNQIESIWCNAREDKASFYEKFGMRRTNQTFNKDGISYVIMEYHLKSI